MKKILTLFCVLITHLSFSAVVNISAYTSDMIASIQGAHDAGANGDNIVLPSGTYACNGVVILTKFISISGQGYANTILYRSESTPDATVTGWSEFFRYNINSTVSSGIKITNLCLKSKNPCLSSTVDGSGVDITALDGLSLAADCGIRMINCKDFAILGCKFQNFGNAAIYVQHDDSIVGGVISNNIFLHNAKGTMALGLGYGIAVYGGNTKWLSAPRFGTSNFIFVEDNTFDYHKHSIAAGGCALYVFRHNTVLNNIAGSSTAAIDAHEGRGPGNGSNTYATRATEVYRNYIHNTTFRNSTGLIADNTPIASIISPTTTHITYLTEACIKNRGAESLIHDNDISGYRFGVAITVNGYCGGSCGAYPVAGQSGYLSGLRYGSSHTGVASGRDAGDEFFWSNTYTPYISGNSANKLFYNYNTDTTYVRWERDYHTVSPIGYAEYTYPHPLAATGNPTTGVTLTGTTVIYTGEAVSNIYIEPRFYIYNWAKDSVVTCELQAFTSYAAMLASSTPILPVINTKRITSLKFKVAPTDTIKASGSCAWSDYYQYLVNKSKANVTSQVGVTTQ